MKKLGLILRYVGLGLLTILVVAVVAGVAIVDDSPYQNGEFYRSTIQAVESAPVQVGEPDSLLRAGWGKAHITPAKPSPLAGYANRAGKLSEGIHDSLFVRAIVLRKGQLKVVIISLDMLIVPPTIAQKAAFMLLNLGYGPGQLYFGASHTHNSLGGWGEKTIGEAFAGKYDQAIVDYVAQAIVQAVRRAEKRPEPVSLAHGKVNAGTLVLNRLIDQGAEYPWAHVIRLQTATGKTALITSFTAHATCLSGDKMFVSNDYPGQLIARLEQQPGVEFALFMAGAVGSHGPADGPSGDDLAQLQFMGDSLGRQVVGALRSLVPDSLSTLASVATPLYLREPQIRLSKNWRVRPWVFHALYGGYPVQMNALRLGSLVLVGLPCDFSGELVPALEAAQAKQGRQLLITSFNGGYVGYITPDSYYNHLDSYETRTMNWFGPGNATYFAEILNRLTQKLP